MKLLKNKKNISSLKKHLEETPHLNRIAGQLEAVKNMITQGRETRDILIQIRSIRAALKSVESNIFNRHMRLLLTLSADAKDEKERKITEMSLFFKQFED